jgi:hypothetical protein
MVGWYDCFLDELRGLCAVVGSNGAGGRGVKDVSGTSSACLWRFILARCRKACR